MSTPDKCPHCGAEIESDGPWSPVWKCGSSAFDQTKFCIERAAHAATKRELETRIRNAHEAHTQETAHLKAMVNQLSQDGAIVVSQLAETRKKLEEVEIKEIAGGYAAQVLRRHVGLDNTKEDLCEVAELFDALKARIQSIEADLAATKSELECEQFAGRQWNAQSLEWSAKVTKAEARVRELERTLGQLKTVLTGPASNSRFMQIAGPARQCLNVISQAMPRKEIP